MKLPLRVTRQVAFWFEPVREIGRFREGSLPIYMYEAENGKPLIYGFPLTGPDTEGVKVALHGSAEVCTPESACRSIRAEDEAAIRERLQTTLPSLEGRLLRAETCLYTMTPDEHFVIGPHPQHPEVIVAAGFSGHGFKFAPAIGEILGELASTGTSRHEIELFSPQRFTAGNAG
jgi:sarcosine oxidase